jgi:hypothetical protein
LEQEAYSLLPGLSESELGDSTLGVVLDSLLPSYKEVISPTPLPTFLGTTPFSQPDFVSSLDPPETRPLLPQRDYTWTRGHGFEHSPIKTRSARRKEGSSSTIHCGYNHKLLLILGRLEA